MQTKVGVLPKPLAGFEDINRYWDKQMGLPAAKILPGELYVSAHGEMISTVLGSCISACIRDKVVGVGGMNHFMLPMQGDKSSWGDENNSCSRYGNWAMEFLVNEILKAGGKKKNFEVKVFGGGRVLANMTSTNIGERNFDFVKSYLFKEGLSIDAVDVGDVFARKVLYFPDTGAVKMKKLRQTVNKTIEKRERDYIDHINLDKIDGEIELF